MFRGTLKKVLALPSMRETRKQFWQTSEKSFCSKPAKRSINLLPNIDPSDINDWVFTTFRNFTDQSPKELRSDSKKTSYSDNSARRKQFWQLSRSVLAQTRKSVQKIYSEKGFVRQLERSFDKPAQNFLLKIQNSSSQSQKIFSGVFILILSMRLLEHLWNRSLKVRKKFIQRTEPLSFNFLSNYSKVYAEWNFGIPYKTVSPKPERCARTIQELLEHFVRLDIYNAGSTIYRELQYEYCFFLKKNYSRLWYWTWNLQF